MISNEKLCDLWISWGVSASDVELLQIYSGIVADEISDFLNQNRFNLLIDKHLIISEYKFRVHIELLCDEILQAYDTHEKEKTFSTCTRVWTDIDDLLLSDFNMLAAYRR